jgi:hypothetical protein
LARALAFCLGEFLHCLALCVLAYPCPNCLSEAALGLALALTLRAFSRLSQEGVGCYEQERQY